MYKCIVTGLGGRGSYWVKQAQAREDVEVVGYVEPAEANRQRAVRDMGVPEASIYNSLDDAIARVQADFIIDVTPPAVHHEVAEKAFAAGLHVLGEKPLSDNFENARKTVEL